jgi:hypothetical protein
MKLIILYFSFLIALISYAGSSGGTDISTGEPIVPKQMREAHDTTILNQLLYNGKVWVGLYYSVHGTEFFLSREWQRGDVSVNGITFKGIKVKYDVYNDDLLIPYQNQRVVILNREAVDSFTVYDESRSYNFINIRGAAGMDGYYELLHSGETKLYRKWKMRRVQFAIEARYDEFQPDNRIILVKGNDIIEITGRKMFMEALEDKPLNLKRYLSRNKIKVDIKSPSSLIPIVEFYDRNEPFL